MNEKRFILKWTNIGPEIINTEKKVLDYDFIKNEIGGLIDVVSYIKLGYQDKKYDIIVDDEGLIKELPVTFAVVDAKNNKICSPLVGPALITKSNAKGETLSLEYDDLMYILSNIYCVGGIYTVLLDNDFEENMQKMLEDFFGVSLI